MLHREVIPNADARDKARRFACPRLRHAREQTRERVDSDVAPPPRTSNKFSFLNDNGIDFDSDRVHLTLDDLERRGPGLLLDQTDRRGSQVLVWTE